MMEDLTLLLPLKVKVKSGHKSIISCPNCGKKHFILPAVVNRFSLKNFEIKCGCRKSFYVKFDVPKNSTCDYDITVTNPLNERTLRNINVQLLDAHHLHFTCKEKLNISKGQKLRVTISLPNPTIPPVETSAVVRLVRGNFVSCFFAQAIDLP